MIYGSLFSQSTDSALSEKLCSAIQWQSSIHQAITYGQFSGGIFTDKRLPLIFTDFYHIDNKTNCLLLFCGSIYNLGSFTSIGQSPAESLQQLYLHEGENFVKQLNGDFSIIIYLKEKQELLLFRDQVGVMPIAFVLQENNFHFSSDVLHLCSVFHRKDQVLNLEAILDGIKIINCNQTPNESVKKLLPGHFLRFNGKLTGQQKYWFPENTKKQNRLSKTEAVEQLRKLISEAVKIRCDKNLIAASHVSGGLDSCLIAALVKKQFSDQKPFYGFSWSPEKHSTYKLEFDERLRVEECCKENNILPVFVPENSCDWINDDPVYFPNCNSFEEDFVLQDAKSKGVQLLFSGWGGDDFASIGHTGVESDLFFHGRWLTLFRNKKKKTLRKKTAHLLYTVLYPFLNLQKKSMKKLFGRNTHYLRLPYQKQDKRAVMLIYQYRSRKDRHLNALADGHLAFRCEMWYNLGIRHGVLYRYPLLDKNIIEFMFSLPSSLLFDAEIERSLFRSVAKDYLPASVFLHERKTDPALNAFSEKYYENFCKQIMQHFSVLKQNPELICFNFDLLEKDLILFEKGKLDESKKESLFNSIFNLYQMDSFIAQYRKN